MRFTTEHGQVLTYTAQYEAWIEEMHYPIVRYDSAHGQPHCDVLDWNGETVEKIWSEERNLNKALTSAIREIRTNWKQLREDFMRRRP